LRDADFPRALSADLPESSPFPTASNSFTVQEQNGMLEEAKSSDWQTRLCIDVGRDFNFFDISQGLSITGSFYYDKGGYSDQLVRRHKRTMKLKT